jgi:L-alanine-DL-glutamate epimerase-like enolase superfamily enzyme
MRELTARIETFPLRRVFTISRGSKTETVVVTATITEDGVRGWGECGPNARYGETPESVCAQIAEAAGAIADGCGRDELCDLLPAGAARNAIDCALWDFEAKATGVSAWIRAGLAPPEPVETAFTLSVDMPDAMADEARDNADRPLLKLKLTGTGDLERVRAVRGAAPNCRLIVDANEAWGIADYRAFVPEFAGLGVALIEQPFLAGDDDALASLGRPVPVCADESFSDTASLAGLSGRYDAVNIKLDKAGGLSEALRAARAARADGFAVMVGCMVGTSLAMAPAMLVAQFAELADLDGPLLLARDREPGLTARGSWLEAAPPELWG